MMCLNISPHLNLVPLVDVDTQNNQILLVRDYLISHSLEEWLTENQGRTLPIEEAVRMVFGILNGLEHLHQQGLFHGALTPSNVLITDTGPVLVEYGLAQILHQENQLSFTVGSLGYLPPEVLAKKFSTQTDIWSAAVLLFQLISGRLPYPHEDYDELVWALNHLPPDSLPARVPEKFHSIIERALARNPLERYQTPAQMREDLISALRAHFPLCDFIRNIDSARLFQVPSKEADHLNHSIPPKDKSQPPVSTPPLEPSREFLTMVDQYLEKEERTLRASQGGRGKWGIRVAYLALLVSVLVLITYTWQSTQVPQVQTKGEVPSPKTPIKESVKPDVPPPTPLPPPKPPTSGGLVVTKDGSGQFSSITSAILVAKPGDTIVIRPGVYEEQILLQQEITLQGEGGAEKVVLRSSVGPCLQMDGTTATVRGLSLVGNANKMGKKAFAVEITQGQLILEDCDISSDTLACVAISGQRSNPILRRCKIHNGASSGVGVWDQAQGTLENCEIIRNDLAGVVIRGASLTIKGCKITHNKFKAIRVYQNGKVTVENCDLTQNSHGPWSIEDGAQVKQSGNKE